MADVSDVFLSYAAENRSAARTIAEVLQRRGLTVAWNWDQLDADAAVEATERELDAARCVVALWSEAAAASGWVEPEALAGLRGAGLVQAHLDGVKIPRRLRRAATVDLTGWDGSRVAPDLERLVDAVAAAVDAAPEPDRPVAAPRATRPPGRGIDVAALLEGGRGSLTGHAGEVYDLAWSADGSRLGSAAADGVAIVWDAGSGRQAARLVGHEGEVNDVVLSPDGGRAATAGDDGTVRVWDVSRQALERRVELDGSAVFGVAYSPDGKAVAAVTTGGLVVVLGADGRERWRVDHGAGLATVRFFPDGTVMVTGDDDGRVVLWDAAAGDPLLAFDAHDDEVTTLAVAPVGQLVASSSEHGGLAVWQIPERTMQWWQSEPAGMIYGTSFSPGGDVLASTDDEGITLWRVDDGEPLGHVADPGSTAVAFSPVGAGLAWASGDTVRVLALGNSPPSRSLRSGTPPT